MPFNTLSNATATKRGVAISKIQIEDCLMGGFVLANPKTGKVLTILDRTTVLTVKGVEACWDHYHVVVSTDERGADRFKSFAYPAEDAEHSGPMLQAEKRIHKLLWDTFKDRELCLLWTNTITRGKPPALKDRSL